MPRTPHSIILCLTLFAATAIGDAHAGDAGVVRWRFEIPHRFPGQFVGVGADGRVYTTSFRPGMLYALEPDGSLVWTLELGGAAAHWPITFAADGTIYTGSASRVCAVNPDGTLRWEFDSRFNNGDWLIAGPTVGPDGNIYAANDRFDPEDLGFFSLDADGDLRWSDRGDPPVSGQYFDLDDIVFGDGRLFAGINFRRSGPWITTYAFDLDGHQLWMRRNVGIEGGPSSNPRMLPDGRLVYRWGQGRLAALNQDGTDDWLVDHPDGAQVLTTPAVGPDGAIYAGDSYGVQLWSANSGGSTRWVLGGDILEHLDSLGVSPDNGTLVAGGWTWTDPINIGWFRGYDPADGTLLWQVDLEPEQGWPQYPHTTKPTFSPNGDTAYVTASFAGDGVGHTYLYAIALWDSTRISAESLEVTRGVLVQGDLAELHESDNDYVVVSARRPTEIAAASVEIEVSATAPADQPGVIEFHVEASATGSPARQRIEMFNYETGVWERVDERDAPMSDSVVRVVITEDAPRFVEPGTMEMKARIGFLDRGVTFPAWGGRFDQAFWMVRAQ